MFTAKTGQVFANKTKQNKNLPTHKWVKIISLSHVDILINNSKAYCSHMINLKDVAKVDYIPPEQCDKHSSKFDDIFMILIIIKDCHFIFFPAVIWCFSGLRPTAWWVL